MDGEADRESLEAGWRVFDDRADGIGSPPEF